MIVAGSHSCMQSLSSLFMHLEWWATVQAFVILVSMASDRQHPGLMEIIGQIYKLKLNIVQNQSFPYQNSVYLKYNVFFDEVYCNHTEKVYFKYTISILGVYFNPCGQIAWSIL